MNRKILQLTLPNIITNVTVPLVGMIDIAIAGRMGADVYLGAIAIGSAIFNFIYWNNKTDFHIELFHRVDFLL